MKMKNVTAMKSLSVAMVAGILMLSSCAKNNDVLNSGDTQNVNSESAADSYTSETSDMATSVAVNVTNTQYASGRVEGPVTGLGDKDGRLKGAIVTITPTTPINKDNPSGTIRIDFGTGTTDASGVVRQGAIVILYYGKKNIANSYRELHYAGYSRNGVAFDNNMVFRTTYTAGTVASPDSSHFNHSLTGGKLTFSDNTTISREADYNVAIVYDATSKKATSLTLSADTGANAKLHSATGTTRAGKDYTMDITKPLVYKAECLATKNYFAVSGAKTITAGLVTYTIDYGDGTCDNTVTITVGGKSVTITVNGDGN
jgi:hypothetical protein